MSPTPPDDLVPRETRLHLELFLGLLSVWNQKINLVSRRESDDIWNRHVVDSAQIASIASPSARTWLDLGSGGGFPGLVCAIIGHAQNRPTRYTLVEAEGRKAAFLREAAGRFALPVTVLHQRIEQLSLPPQDIISARALAPLDKLLSYAEPFSGPETAMLFPKGRQADSELTEARRAWHSRVVRFPSRTDSDATILRLSEVSRRS